jgi:superfamily II DNA or RNA helicase
LSNEIIISKPNEVYFKLQLNVEQSLELREFFSVHVKNYFFQPRYKAKIWDGRISFYNKNCLPIGLFDNFKQFCKKFNYQYKFDFDQSQLTNQISDQEINQLYNEIFKDSRYYPRDYQDSCIKTFLRNKRGVCEVATGAGKSLIIYVLMRYLLKQNNKKILLIVPVINLTEQLFSDVKDYGFQDVENNISLIYSNSKKIKIDNRIVVSTWQSVYKKDESFFDQFGTIIVDEVHVSKAACLQELLKKTTKCDFRVGLTGTLPSDKCELMQIFGYLGPKVYEIKSEFLIDKGILSQLKIANLILKYPKDIVDCSKNLKYDKEIKLINSYKKRNDILKFIINGAVKKEENVLILIREIDHLKIVKKYLEENFKDFKIHEIFGMTKSDDREEIRKSLNETSGNILLGSYGTVSQGLNICRLHHLIFFSSYSSKIKVLQSLGRILRTHDSKSQAIVYDVVDDLTYMTKNNNLHKNYVFKQFQQRLQYYKSQGFNFVSKIIDMEKL